jgi:hypothetical protein
MPSSTTRVRSGIWQPPALLVTEAGGRFRDPRGGSRLDLGGGLYCNTHLEEDLVALLRSTGWGSLTAMPR